MAAKHGFPSLAFLYETKIALLTGIIEKGHEAAINPEAPYAADISRPVTRQQALEAVEKMIEAVASLRDFEQEPFSRREQKALDQMWLLESGREGVTVTL